MARSAKGWNLSRDDRTQIYFVRFSYAGRRRKLSTGERDPGTASIAASKIYAEVVSGRRTIEVDSKTPAYLVEEVAAKWLCAVESSLDSTTFEQYEIYVSAHWQTFFGTMDHFVDASIEDYKSARLRKVKRTTLLKELSALRGFLKWAEQHEFLAAMPLIESPPPKVTGTADKKKPHKTEPVPLDETEVEQLIQHLPEFSKRSRWSEPYPVRARFEVAWETGLRPATLDSLMAPLDYKPGRTTLRVRDEADKARDGRELPLSDRARAALDRICPTEGLIFGQHDYRAHLRAAAKAAGLPPEKATKISSYDFRHGRLTHFAENAGDNIPGIMYLVGHRHATTTDKYIRRSRRAAENVLATMESKKVVKDAAKRSPDPAFRSHNGLTTGLQESSETAGSEKAEENSVVRKKGVEPSRCYPQEPESCASASSATFASSGSKPSRPG